MAEVLAAHGRELAQLAEEQHAFWMESIRLAFAHMSAELQLEEGRLLVPEARVLSKDSINQFLKEKLNAERREKALAEKALERPLGQQFPSRQPAIPDACSVPEQALSPPVSQTVSMGRPADRDFQATICAIPETRQISTNILSPQISEATAVRPDKGRQWFDTGAAVLVLARTAWR
ncbi:unnamed protein product [Effrenium voratum]|uniref:Uncharacterized protein n=1 Tax=Effrenium voratum TaxID=2562239 RepID=A0AA36MJQ6_9DINO|nr:unnamed protein product [Effrenium voratum]CAJ1370800.1 unnamed protein product [Effrenium voratum]CAJ1415018.1 unnamed protein product [Effrenium voratum]